MEMRFRLDNVPLFSFLRPSSDPLEHHFDHSSHGHRILIYYKRKRRFMISNDVLCLI